MKPLISIQNIHKAFGNNEIYRGVSLDVYPGEVLTLVGGSGTGKSVLLKMILSLIESDQGSIIFDGKDILAMNDSDLRTMRKRIGMLFQGAALFDSLNIYENIAYPLREHFDLPEAEIERRVAEKLALVGLPGIELMMPESLSGGMKKRVGLARAIATDPEIILYDEPTTGLDPTNTHRINKLIRELQQKLKVTSLVVTHDMQSVFYVSDRVALLQNKCITFVGDVQDCQNEAHQDIYKFVRGEVAEAL